MSEVTLASLAMEVAVPTADAAIDKLTRLRKVASELEGQAGRTASASKEQASAHGYAGTAAAQAERTMRQLSQVYGDVVDGSGRFRHSVEAEVAMLLQNAKAQAALAREQDAAARAVQRLTSSYDPLGGELLRTNRQLAEAEALYRKGAISAAQYGAVTDGLRGKLSTLEQVTTTGVKSSRSLQYATLNLGHQALDLGQGFAAAAASGEPLKMVMMTLMQQGPQLVGIFAEMKTQGLGVSAALGGIWAAIAPIAVPLLAIGAAATAAFGLFEREIDKNTKNATSWGDTWNATVKVIGRNLMNGPIGEALKWLGGAFSKTLDFIVDGVTGWYDRTVGLFIAAYKTITTHWKDLPAAFGAIMVGAANGVISGIQFIVDGAMGAINYFRKKAGMDEFARVELPKLTQANNAAARDFEKYWTEATASVRKSREGFADDVARQADKEFEKRQKAKKATEDHTKAILANNDAYRAGEDALTGYLAKLNEEIATMGMSAEQLRRRQAEQMALAADTPQIAEFIRQVSKMYEDQARVGKEAAEVQKAIGAAANDNIRVFDALGVVIPTAMENAAYELERAANEARNFRYDIEDVAYAINNNDWTSAFAGLAKVLANVEKAFKTATTAKEKYSAVAMLAQGVGGAIGGTGGAVVGGAGSGALAGLSAGSALTTLGLAVPGPGWALAAGGAVLGAIGGLFGSSKAKKQAKAQAEAQRLAEEAARQEQIANTALQLRIDLLKLEGKTAEAMALEQQSVLAKLDPSLHELQRQLWATQAATEAAAEAARLQAEADAMAAKAKASQRSIILDLMAMDDAVTGGNSAVLAARQDELAALDPVSRALKEIYFARLDEGAAMAKQAAEAEAFAAASTKANELWAKSTADTANKVAEAAQRQAEAMRSLGDSFVNAMQSAEDAEKSLRSFAESLLSELGLGGQQASYSATRSALQANAARGEFDQSLAQAFLDASKATQSSASGYQSDVAWVRSLALTKADDLAGYPARLAMLFRAIQADSMSGLPGFANGGSMVIGGNPGVDQNVLSLNGAPVARVGYGETLSVTPAGGSANDNSLTAEVRALRADFAEMKAALVQTAVNTGKTARQISGWDGNGMPAERGY